MKIKAFGIQTGTIYAIGTEQEVHQELIRQYPTFSKKTDRRGQIRNNVIYPEPIAKVKIL